MLLLLACQDPEPGYDARDPSTDTGDPTDDTGPPIDTTPVAVVLPDECSPATPGPAPMSLLGVVTTSMQDLWEIVDVEIDGAIAWTVGQGGLVPVDVSDPTRPAVLSFDASVSSRLHRVERLPGEYIAGTNREVGLDIFNISDPASPTLAFRRNAAGWEGLASVGDRLYVAVRDEGILVLDVTNPEQPVETGRDSGLVAPWEILETDGWLYAADATLGVVPIAITDPDAPAIGEPVPLPEGSAYDLAASGGYLYVAVGSPGVAVFDLSDASAPSQIATVATGGTAVSVATTGTLLYVADHEGYQAFDLADPANPTPISRVAAQQVALAVAARDDLAFVGDWLRFEVWQLDTTTPAPALHVANDELTAAGGVAETTLSNQGGADLHLLGGTGATFTVGTDVLRPGEKTWMRVADPKGVTPLCLGSDDPYTPQREITLREGGEPPVGEVAADFTLPVLTGGSAQLSEHFGEVIFLTLFATW